MATLLDETLIADTLKSLPGWQGDQKALWREVSLPADDLAELQRMVAVDAGAMGHGPTFEAGRVVLTTAEAGGVTELDVMMASHISDLLHRLSHAEPGVAAERTDDPVAVIRPGQSGTGETDDEGPELGRDNTAMLES